MWISDDAQDFIVSLLNIDQTQRLGTKNGVDEVLQHQWLRDIDTKALLEKKLKPKYIP